MSGRVASAADKELIAAVTRQAGLRLEPRQLERWRQAKVLMNASVTRLGRGRGTTSRYPPEAVERCIEISEILKDKRSLRDVLLVLFWRGRKVDLDAVRAAYRRLSNDLVSGIVRAAQRRPTGQPFEDAFDIAEPAALAIHAHASRNKLAAPVRRRLHKVKGETPTAAMFDGLLAEALYGFLTGGIVDADNESLLNELKAGAGIAAAQQTRVLGVGPLLADVDGREFAETFAAVTPAALEAALCDASDAELESARDDFRHVMALLANVARAAVQVNGERDVWGLESVRLIYGSEVLLAQMVPVWLVQRRRLQTLGITPDPVFRADTPEGREQAALLAACANEGGQTARE